MIITRELAIELSILTLCGVFVALVLALTVPQFHALPVPDDPLDPTTFPTVFPTVPEPSNQPAQPLQVDYNDLVDHPDQYLGAYIVEQGIVIDSMKVNDEKVYLLDTNPDHRKGDMESIDMMYIFYGTNDRMIKNQQYTVYGIYEGLVNGIPAVRGTYEVRIK